MDDEWILDSPTVFFRERLRKAFSHQRVEPSEAAEAYLVWLLERFLTVRGDLLASPLGLAYLEARQDVPAVRFAKLKSIADTALFVTGVFLESVEASSVGAGYYVSLGGTAYRDLATLPRRRESRDAIRLFDELSTRFRDFVRVLGEIDLQDPRGDNRETFKIYRRWLASQGARDAVRLMRRGIVPFVPRKHSLH